MAPVLTRLDDPRAFASLVAPPAWPALTADEAAQHAPDASLTVTDGGALRARCSLWWTDVPPLEGRRPGVIGHYGAAEATDARMLLDAAVAELARHGCTTAVGPMDGNTWRRYRLVVERGTEPPFFLEPDNPDDWPAQFTGAGFSPIAHYFSAVNTDLSAADPRADAAAERLAAHGVTVRSLDLSRFEEELHRIYAVATESFASAFLYTPLPEAAFAGQYHKVRGLVRPELVFIAEHEGRPVGFAFSLPDPLEAKRGEPPRTVIIKTVAILPERKQFGGLGTLMTDRTHRAARALGFTRAVHALMHESNQSRAISARTGQPMRRYALFAREIGPR